MIELLLILASIALLDSLSMVPLAIVPMTVALGSSRPWIMASSFVAGIYVAYFLCGIPVLAGAEVLIDQLGDYFERLWNRPNALELTIQILVGALLIVSTKYLWKPKPSNPKPETKPASSPKALFLLGVTLVVLGMPGAVPYLAAIERIAQQDLNWLSSLGYLIFYNGIFILPLLGLIGLRAILGQRVEPWFQRLGKLCLTAMPKLTTVLFLIVGVIMVADGIGWFLGYPLLPVSP